MGEWRRAKLGDLIDLRHGFAFKGEFFHDEPPGDFLLTPGNFAIGGGFKWAKRKYYRDGPVPDEYVLCPGDLLVTMTDLSKEADTLGYPAVVPESSQRFLHNQRLGKVIIKSDALDKSFVHWLLRSPEYRNEILASYTGSTVKHTSPKKILAYQLDLPPLDEQRAIARVLDAFESKIELNRRMNETLESMARAIFNDWFVDFGPTRAKAEGRAPYLAREIWDLFPDALDEKGKPDGWSMGSLIDCATKVQNGGTPRRSEETFWSTPDIPWLTSAEVRQDIVIDTQNFISEEGLARSSAKMLPAMVPLVALYGATAGQVTLSAIPLSTNQAISAVIPRNGHRYYALAHLKREVQSLSDKAVGSAQQNISKKIVEELPTLLPDERCIRGFDELATPLYETAVRNLKESRTLTQMRDLLLPKLMSGEIRLREAERAVEAVA